ncbi:alpha/beta fold hydrolase [Streptomonospora nanhaiensis]|uniref:alpha/beta fold hydrolase n=1 Tax=Streptomonospora nanhaiensis TaxID=1323731 RepID=UPI001C38AA85|nr:alpha/beta hydrolase [Streptomonospora nanhaiensis]MBV2362612.1 alpha/beta hydrolase [Streptomonospora nanhaiensis]
MIPLRQAADQTRTVRTPDGAELRVHLRGPVDAPVTVVLAHDWALASDTWRPTVARLVAGPRRPVRVVRFDQRGHGGSTLGTRPFSAAVLGEDLLRVLEDCAPHGPLVLGGHSMGGRAVMALAAARPGFVAGRVAGVLLAATAAGRLDPDDPGLPPHRRAAGVLRRALARGLARAPGAVDRLRALLPPHSGAYRAAVRRAAFGTRADPLAVRECAQLLHTTPTRVAVGFYEPLVRHDLSGRLGALRAVPVRILAGGRDRLVRLRHTRALARALPLAAVAVLPDCGHMLPLEAPEAVGAHLEALAALAGEAA